VASVVLVCDSLKTFVPVELPASIPIRIVTVLLANTSPRLFLKTDWKFILLGACEKANNGKNRMIMILAFMLLVLNFSKFV
jgi:hypothetical protein